VDSVGQKKEPGRGSQSLDHAACGELGDSPPPRRVTSGVASPKDGRGPKVAVAV
jgi:hypothetical protein